LEPEVSQGVMSGDDVQRGTRSMAARGSFYQGNKSAKVFKVIIDFNLNHCSNPFCFSMF